MEYHSPFLAMQQAERQIKTQLRSVDIDLLEPTEKKAVLSLKRLAVDARIDIRDYELSETRTEQLKYATAAKKDLAKLRGAILAVGSAFGPADVAQLTAELELIENWVR